VNGQPAPQPVGSNGR